MLNKSLRRALATVASFGLAFAGLSATAAPAQAAASTTFKIHLNVPKEVTQDWNIWYWNTGDVNVGPVNNTIGSSTVTVGGVPVTMDWTPNFDQEDSYGAYAEFTLPVALTALNNVMRTTESWDGQTAVDAVVDDPATADVDETAAAKPAIAASDKPFGGDNIFPAGESWWNLGTGKREYPLKDVVSYKVHVNMPLATALAQGWNVYTWGTTVEPGVLANYAVTTTTTKKVGKKTVTTKKTTKPYAGKVPTGEKGWPFVGEDKFGAYAIVKSARAYSTGVGFIPRRGDSTNAWKVQSGDFKLDNSNGLIPGVVDNYVVLGSSENSHVAPAFVGRFGATATFADGTITVTPVRPANAAMKGAYPTKIVVTAKKGSTTKTCTIQSSATASVIADAHWALGSSCDITGITVPALADGDATWEIYVQASSDRIGTGPGATDKANAKVVVAAQ